MNVQVTEMIKNNPSHLLEGVRNHFEQSGMKLNETYVQEMLKTLTEYDVISFDVFDTLVTRLLECPIDVFAYIEAELLFHGFDAEDFAKKRLFAEQTARDIAYKNRRAEEITIDEIYTVLFEQFGYPQDLVEIAKKCEKLCEIEICVAISDNLELIKKLKSIGKTIICVSDMYLNPEDIEAILHKNGFNQYDHLFVSSKLNKTKHTGKIWDIVKATIGEDKKIFHIGDNIHADVEKPKQLGIQAFHYSRFLNERRVGAELSPLLLPFSFLSQAQKLRQTPHQDVAQKEIWHTLGSSLGAIILYSFTTWLSEHVKTNKIDHVFFCARDAQIIDKVWQLRDLNTQLGCTSSYLYVSRKVLRYSLCYIEIMKNHCLSQDSLYFLINESCGDNATYRDIFKPFDISDEQIYKHGFKEKIGDLNYPLDWSKIDTIKDYIQEYLLDDLKPSFKVIFDNTTGYYQQAGLLDNNKKFAIVDLGWSGTIQMSIINIREYFNIHTKVYGYYYGLFREHVVGRFFKNGFMTSAFWKPFLRKNETYVLRNAVNILENLHSANHETTINFIQSEQGIYSPVFKSDENGHYLSNFNNTIAIFQNAVLETIQQWHEYGNSMGVAKEYITPAVAVSAIAQVVCSPNKQEIQALGRIQHSACHHHETFQSLIPEKLPHKTSRVYSYLHNGGWAVGVMTHWINQGIKSTDYEMYQVARREFDDYGDLIKTKL